MGRVKGWSARRLFRFVDRHLQDSVQIQLLAGKTANGKPTFTDLGDFECKFDEAARYSNREDRTEHQYDSVIFVKADGLLSPQLTDRGKTHKLTVTEYRSDEIEKQGAAAAAREVKRTRVLKLEACTIHKDAAGTDILWEMRVSDYAGA